MNDDRTGTVFPDDYYNDAVFYDATSLGVEGDVAFFVEEARKARGPVLELACGTGRITIPVAEDGTAIVGLDRSPKMLALAKRKIAAASAETRQRIELVEGDMRNFALSGQFNLIMIPYRAFQHVHTVADQRQCLSCVHRHLADGGLFIVDVFDPNLSIIAEHMGPLGASLKKMDTTTHPETGRPLVVWETRKYAPETQSLKNWFIFEELNEKGEVLTKTYSTLRLRYFHRYEMQHLLERSGFTIEALYGDFGRGPFRHGGEQLWMARKT